MNKHRLKFLIRKEFIQIFRNPMTLRMILVIPIVQTLLFGYVTTTDVKNIKLLVCDLDQSAYSRELAAKLTNTGYFTKAAEVSDLRSIDQYLDQGLVKAAVVFPSGLASDVTAGRTGNIQIMIDGSNSSEASIAQSYLQKVLANESIRLIRQQLSRAGTTGSLEMPIDTRPRVWFNPELKSVYYMIPGLICMVLFQMTSMLTALGIVREKEQGTMEQIIVSPITTWELIAGKTLPFALMALIDVVLVMLLGTLWFGVILKGSLFHLFGASIVFIFTVLGIGMLVSTISHTQSQAMMINQFFMATNMLLSGFMFPISSMPQAMQYFTYLVPLRYFLEIVRSIFLKGTGPAAWWPQLLFLAVFGVLTFGFSALMFKKRLD
ncbi:ABC transporter permease [candidate division TA06 bacterium]|nr:ABC transporter permease [candidate division TA06 bacterium]